MPELPEVETVARELNRKLKDKTIKTVEVNAPKMVSLGPGTVSNIRAVSLGKVEQFRRRMTGLKIASVSRRAKLLIFDLDGPLSLLVHLKLTGQFIYEDKSLRQKTGGYYRLVNKLTAPKELLPSKHTHVILRFTDGSTLYFNDIRKFGYLKLVKDEDLPKVKELQEFGPEPLGQKFTYEVFVSAVKKRPRGKIKQVLMDPKVVAGIGNIYSDEILFQAKVRPARLVSKIRDEELREIYKYIKIVLKKAIQAKGSSVGDFIRTDGSWGRMGKFHFVYGRRGEPCKRCGSVIQAFKFNGRTGSFCPQCQK